MALERSRDGERHRSDVCIEAEPTLTATPQSSGPQEPGTTFSYDLTITNHDVSGCGQRTAFPNTRSELPGIAITLLPEQLDLAPGATGHLSLQVTGSADAEPGATQIPVDVFVAVPPKLAMQSLVLNPWPRTADGKLDLRRAPLRLLAIVNRIDSRNLAQGHAGEGRFVFGVIGPQGFPEQFTVIFEFRLPAQTPQDVLDWASRWHALGAQPFPSESSFGAA
jgi:hypothetical protein